MCSRGARGGRWEWDTISGLRGLRQRWAGAMPPLRCRCVPARRRRRARAACCSGRKLRLLLMPAAVSALQAHFWAGALSCARRRRRAPAAPSWRGGWYASASSCSGRSVTHCCSGRCRAGLPFTRGACRGGRRPGRRGRAAHCCPQSHAGGRKSMPAGPRGGRGRGGPGTRRRAAPEGALS